MTARSTRRDFLKHSVVAGASAAFTAASWSRVYGANEKLNIASVGPGGKGWSDLVETAKSPHVNVVALCDIDESTNHLGRAAEKFPAAKKFFDYRKLLDDANAKTFDAIIVSTPDHMHAPISLPAMQLGKHVHCQKPLTHTVHEARQMRLAAKTYNVVTQMGNQIQSHEFYRTAVKLVHDGAIGKVKEVYSWQSGAMGWMLADDRPAGEDPLLSTVHWDEWLGVAPTRPFKNKIYHSFNWRAWQEFSNGQLGDFGCHILDPVFMALKLTSPTSVFGDAPKLNKEVWARWSKVIYEFPGTELTGGKPITVTWFDGEGHKPANDLVGVPAGFQLPGSGSVLVGEKGSLLIPHVAPPKLFPEEKFADFKIQMVPARDHYVSWADACRGEGHTTSLFDYSGPLTETVLLGTIAIRLPAQTLRWNTAELKFANNDKATALLTKPYRKGFEPKWL
ncbi:NADH-dependent dehydrogenase [Planctomycetia bacterium]|nr:NADH-dependent dehydrogenase [Planctomycetia bacterium]